MANSRSASASARSKPAPSTRRAPRREPARPPLRVVRPDETAGSVGALGSSLAVCLFVTLLALAGLHAVLVQAQAGLDDLVVENSIRHERVDQLLAEVAHLDSPEGVAEQATAAGLVAAPEVVTIAPLAPGSLAPPPPDPFGRTTSLISRSGGDSSG